MTYPGSAGGQPRLTLPFTRLNPQDPKFAEKFDAITRTLLTWANSLKAATPGPPGVSWNFRHVTGNTTAAPGDYIVFDGAGGPFVGSLTLPSTTAAGQMIGFTILNEGSSPGSQSAISLVVPTGVNFNGQNGPYTSTHFLNTYDYAIDPSVILIAASTTDWVIFSTSTAMPDQGLSSARFSEIITGLLLTGPLYTGVAGFSAGDFSVVDGSEIIVPMSGLPNNCVFNTTNARYQINIVINNDVAAGNVNLSGGGTYNGPASLAPGHSAIFVSIGTHTYCIGSY